MQTFLSVVKLLPALFAGVRSIEDAIPVPNQGAAKAEFLIGIVGDIVAESADLAPALQKIVGRIVTLFKATGVFK